MHVLLDIIKIWLKKLNQVIIMTNIDQMDRDHLKLFAVLLYKKSYFHI